MPLSVIKRGVLGLEMKAASDECQSLWAIQGFLWDEA